MRKKYTNLSMIVYNIFCLYLSVNDIYFVRRILISANTLYIVKVSNNIVPISILATYMLENDLNVFDNVFSMLYVNIRLNNITMGKLYFDICDVLSHNDNVSMYRLKLLLTLRLKLHNFMYICPNTNI